MNQWKQEPENGVALSDPSAIANLHLDGLVITRDNSGLGCVGYQLILDENGTLVEKRVVVRFSLTSDAVENATHDVVRLFSEFVDPRALAQYRRRDRTAN